MSRPTSFSGVPDVAGNRAGTSSTRHVILCRLFITFSYAIFVITDPTLDMYCFGRKNSDRYEKYNQQSIHVQQNLNTLELTSLYRNE